MFSEHVTDNPPDMENTPVNDRLDELEGKIDGLHEEIHDLTRAIVELKDMLAPIGPFLTELPELMKKVGPLFEALKESPVLKMIGVRL